MLSRNLLLHCLSKFYQLLLCLLVVTSCRRKILPLFSGTTLLQELLGLRQILRKTVRSISLHHCGQRLLSMLTSSHRLLLSLFALCGDSRLDKEFFRTTIDASGVQ